MRGEVRASITPLCPAGHLPLKGGDRQEAHSPLNSRALRWPRPNHESISPLEGEMPGRAEGGKPHPHSERRSRNP
ncbi:lytic murein transglycosylase [Agrobacterium tumefaciens]|uniref:Lytic murein transglycosylase n=1 Tax=Agrobacterium tumefaciens TaxID=358 RepID=A0A546Y064_AGRTU|nr:lytic murein transglycosylase [Agrobacterium tumefaciens]